MIQEVDMSCSGLFLAREEAFARRMGSFAPGVKMKAERLLGMLAREMGAYGVSSMADLAADIQSQRIDPDDAIAARIARIVHILETGSAPSDWTDARVLGSFGMFAPIERLGGMLPTGEIVFTSQTVSRMGRATTYLLDPVSHKTKFAVANSHGRADVIDVIGSRVLVKKNIRKSEMEFVWWDATDNNETTVWRISENTPNPSAYFPIAHCLFTADIHSQKAQIVDMVSGTPREIKLPRWYSRVYNMTPNGVLLCEDEQGSQVHLIDSATGGYVDQWSIVGGTPMPMVVLASGSILMQMGDITYLVSAPGGSYKEHTLVKLHDVALSKREFDAYENPLNPDQVVILDATTGDGLIRLCFSDKRTGALVSQLEIEKEMDAPRRLAVTPDGRVLFSQAERIYIIGEEE